MEVRSREEILEELKLIIAEITGYDPEELHEEDSLSEDIGIESFDIVDINFRVEETFGVEMGDKVFWNFRDLFGDPDLIDENNNLTLAGIQEVKRRVPNLDPDGTLENRGTVNFSDMLAQVKVRHFVDFLEQSQRG